MYTASGYRNRMQCEQKTERRTQSISQIKVHVTLKDLGKSRQSLHVAFQYFLSDKEAKNTRYSQHFFAMFKFNIAAKRGQVHLGNAFPVEPTALRPFLLKLGHSVLRFGKTEFQRKLFVSVAVNAKLLRLFLWTRDSHR